jgi:hypothetical protein
MQSRQPDALREVHHERDVAVRARRNDESRLEALQSFHRVGPWVQPVPGSVHVIELGLGKPLDAVARDKFFQALAMQDIEDRERPPSGAHFVHRGLVELAPFDRELEPVDTPESFLPGKGREVSAHARAPVDHGAEDVEETGPDVHALPYLNWAARLLLDAKACCPPRSIASRARPRRT